MMNKQIIVSLSELDIYLEKVYAVFQTTSIIDKKISQDNIVNYYHNSMPVYKYVHSYQGSVHMALNYDGIYDKKGFLTQLNEISELIKSSSVKKVLELGCGKGFNALFLAGKLTDVEFLGIDITEVHLRHAIKKSWGVENLDFSYGDFHKLNYEDASFDLIFEMEAVCHAEDQYQVLSEAFRVLKKGGIFVLYDGFRQIGFESLPDNLIKAAILTEKSLAVNRFERIDAWLKLAVQAGFKVKVKQDLSQAIMPNLARLQLLARKYFEFPLLSKMFLKLFPENAMGNCIAVLLMPFTFHNRAHGYYKIILEK